MKTKVFIAQTVPKEVEEYIGRHCEYKVWGGRERISEEELLRQIGDVEGILAPPYLKVNQKLLNGGPDLKVISNVAVGYDNFDIRLMKKNKIMGTHTPGVLDETVADLAFGLLIAVSRKITYLDKYTKSGNWKSTDNDEFLGVDIHHKTLGIIGMGRIGEKIAKRASLGFDMKVLYNNRNRRKDIEEKYNIFFSEIDQLLKESDFVLVMVPHTSETDKMFGKKEFELMKKSAFFINTARGKVVNENDLIEALQKKEIAGAGLDVFENEPISSDNPLLKMDNVITLPHIGSATKQTRFDMAMKGAENLIMGVKGCIPTDLVPDLKDVFKK